MRNIIIVTLTLVLFLISSCTESKVVDDESTYEQENLQILQEYGIEFDETTASEEDIASTLDVSDMPPHEFRALLEQLTDYKNSRKAESAFNEYFGELLFQKYQIYIKYAEDEEQKAAYDSFHQEFVRIDSIYSASLEKYGRRNDVILHRYEQLYANVLQYKQFFTDEEIVEVKKLLIPIQLQFQTN